MDRIYDKAFRLYIHKVSGQLSPEEDALLQTELAGNMLFRRVWDRLEREGAGLAEFVDGLDPETELEALKRRAGLAVIHEEPAEAPVRRIFLTRPRAAIAAAVFLLAGAGYYFFAGNTHITDKEKIAKIVSNNQQAIQLTLGNGKSVTLDRDSVRQTIVADQATLTAQGGTLQYKSEDTAQNTLSIPAGQNYSLVLSDGTEVLLNAATHLRFPFKFNARSREVFVDGEAFFKVARDVSRPFIVHTPLTQVQVLGTSFNINSYTPGNVTTSLVDGKVITRGQDGKDVALNPGYAADFQSGKGFATEKFDRDEVLSWMNGTYYFHNTPVNQLTDVIFRCYGLNIVMDKEKFAHRSVTGLMDRKKLVEFLDDLETTAHIKYYYSGNQLRLE